MRNQRFFDIAMQRCKIPYCCIMVRCSAVLMCPLKGYQPLHAFHGSLLFFLTTTTREHSKSANLCQGQTLTREVCHAGGNTGHRCWRLLTANKFHGADRFSRGNILSPSLTLKHAPRSWRMAPWHRIHTTFYFWSLSISGSWSKLSVFCCDSCLNENFSH